jgi:hypothetical protein
MTLRSRTSLGAALLAALLVTGPARAGGPYRPPDGQLTGFTTHYRIPSTFLKYSDPGQCLLVHCFNPTEHDAVSIGIEIWDNGLDPDRDPIQSTVLHLDRSGGNLYNFCTPGSHLVTGRIVAAPIKKLTIECAAEIIDFLTQRTVSSLPLVPAAKKKKRK